jgi:OOP family OmpA-OmpF porin
LRWRRNGAKVVLLGLLAACPERQVVAPEPGSAVEPVVDRDRDGDGVADGLDVCPGAVGEAPHGCPDLDVDGDGILVMFDGCPEEPETRNGLRDEDGCPDELPLQFSVFTGTVPTVYFARDDAGVADDAQRLDRAAAILLEYPAIEVVISGHTDDREGRSRSGRRKLSLRRAEAVRDYLVGRGVARERLEVRGAGAGEPVDVNTTEAGRAKNRRVEYAVVVQ